MGSAGSPRCLARAGEFSLDPNPARLDLLADSTAFCNSQIIVILKIHPELRRQTEIFPQTDGSVSTDSTVSPDDLIDAREIQRLGQFIRGHPHGLHELSF